MTSAERLAHRARMIGRMATAWGRPGPDFLIIGAQKCGTTSLYNYLLCHPAIVQATKRSIKFFDHGPNWAKGRMWYQAHFPFAPARTAPAGRPLVGECTPSYLVHPLGPRRVHLASPQARLIVLLRNPVDRAYSAYHHQTRKGRETLSFEAALDREAERVADEHARLAAEPGFVAHGYRLHSYVGWGRYVEHLEPWLATFARDRILLLRTEDLAADSAGVLAQVHAFLGLSPVRLQDYPRLNTGRYDSLDPRIRKRLADEFEPYNRCLAALLGRDPGWQG
jgi:Sulfotransferase domain